MQRYKTLKELSDHPILQEFIHSLSLVKSEEEPFMHNLGGDLFILEFDHEKDRIFRNMGDPDYSQEYKGYSLYFYINNNSGGPTYAVKQSKS